MSILPWNNLKTYVHDMMKDLQEIIDSIAPDPGADNSMLPLASLPYRFDCTFYCTASTNDLIDGYSAWDKGYGQQPWLIGYRLNLNNNVLRVFNQNFMGKCAMSSPDRWGWLNNEDIATIEAAGREVYSTQIQVVNNYPTNTIKVIGGSNGTISFKPLLHDITDIQFKYPMKNDTWETRGTALVVATTAELPEYNENTGFYDSPYYADYQGIGSQPNYSVYSNLIAVFDSISEAEDVVDALSPYNTNNDVINYTKTGSEYKLYYGDHYLIYALDDSKVYNYQDLYTGTSQATGRINTWNPTATPIVTPTYDEVKHEDDPEDLEDDDQEDGGVYGPADFCHLYACTRGELENLQKWMSGGAAGGSGDSPVTVPDNFDPMAQVVGLIGYPMEIDTDDQHIDDTTFLFRAADNQTVNTGWATKKLSIVEREIDMGSVTVTPWGKDFKDVPWLDYSATVECYIPFCGVVPLDPQSVMGCKLTCKMWVCFATGDVSAIIYSNINGGQHPVAYASGNCGASQPISAAAFGSLMGARAAADHKMSQAVLGGVKNAVTGTLQSVKTGYIQGGAASTVGVPAGQSAYLARAIQGAGAGLGAGAGAAFGAITSAVDLGVNLTLQNLDNRYNYTVAKNSLGTTIAGSFGQMTSWHYENHCYIKVTWPTPKSDAVDNYGRTYGVPVHKSGTVGEYSGYTVCNNVDCSGITKATVSEQALIKQYLESGVYVNGGE